jgi:hypothetical protein
MHRIFRRLQYVKIRIMSYKVPYCKYPDCVLRYAMHVRKNVKNIHKWIIVSNVLKHVESVLKNVAGFLRNTNNSHYQKCKKTELEPHNAYGYL